MKKNPKGLNGTFQGGDNVAAAVTTIVTQFPFEKTTFEVGIAYIYTRPIRHIAFSTTLTFRQENYSLKNGTFSCSNEEG